MQICKKIVFCFPCPSGTNAAVEGTHSAVQGCCCAAASGMVTQVSEAVLWCRVRKVSPLLLLRALRDSTPSPWMCLTQLLLLVGNKILKTFFPHFSKQSSHPGQWVPYCAHHHMKLGLVQKKNAISPLTNVWHRFLGMVDPKEKPWLSSRGKLGAADILCLERHSGGQYR